MLSQIDIFWLFTTTTIPAYCLRKDLHELQVCDCTVSSVNPVRYFSNIKSLSMSTYNKGCFDNSAKLS